MHLINPRLAQIITRDKQTRRIILRNVNKRELEKRKKKMRVRKVSFRHHAKRRETVTQEIRRRRTSGKIDEERARLMETVRKNRVSTMER